MINLREVILKHRVRYYVDGSPQSIEKALGCLERYLFLLAFCSYVNENFATGYTVIFSQWLTARAEIFRVLESMRKKGPKLYLFRPVEDLSALSGDNQVHIVGWGSKETQPLANELEQHVLRSREGTVLVSNSILKIDQWFLSEARPTIEGAPNFR